MIELKEDQDETKLRQQLEPETVHETLVKYCKGEPPFENCLVEGEGAAEAETEVVVEGIKVEVGVREFVVLGALLSDMEGDIEIEREGVREGVPNTVFVGVTEAVTEEVVVIVGVTEGLTVGVVVGVTDGGTVTSKQRVLLLSYETK